MPEDIGLGVWDCEWFVQYKGNEFGSEGTSERVKSKWVLLAGEEEYTLLQGDNSNALGR
jgi:hypothetical protein